jgi:hypothetical protein
MRELRKMTVLFSCTSVGREEERTGCKPRGLPTHLV